MLDLKEVTTLLKYNGIHATAKKLNVKKSAIHQFLKANGLVYKDGSVEIALDLAKASSNLIDIKTPNSQNTKIQEKTAISLTNYEANHKEKKRANTSKAFTKKDSAINLKKTSSQNKKNLQNTNIEKLNYLLENVNMEKLKLLVNNIDEILEMLTSYRILKSEAQKETASTLHEDH